MLFGSSGIRQEYSQSLLRLALSTGAAVSASADKVIMGRDTRTTGQLLADSFMAGALSAGADVYYGGIAPTPTVAFATRGADLGCMITASHNPERYNGMKLINPDGSSFTKAQQKVCEEEISQMNWKNWENQGEVHSSDLITPHCDAILDKIEIKEGISMVIDCGNGAGGMITPGMLSSAGVKVHCLNCNPSGIFARPSEPLETNLPYVGRMVRKTGARGAVIHDGDADRFMAFDQKGRYISGDHLLMLFSSWLGAEKVVTTVDASMAIEEIAEVHRTPVGDSYVSEKLIDWGDFGGEPSGSWIFPGHSLCPDGIYTAALFCQIAAEWDVAEEIDKMPDYPILRSSYHCPNPAEVVSALGADCPTDGIRIEDENGWCLVRASGTEPKVRITAEGRTKAAATAMQEKGQAMLRKGRPYTNGDIKVI